MSKELKFQLRMGAMTEIGERLTQAMDEEEDRVKSIPYVREGVEQAKNIIASRIASLKKNKQDPEKDEIRIGELSVILVALDSLQATLDSRHLTQVGRFESAEKSLRIVERFYKNEQAALERWREEEEAVKSGTKTRSTKTRARTRASNIRKRKKKEPASE